MTDSSFLKLCTGVLIVAFVTRGANAQVTTQRIEVQGPITTPDSGTDFVLALHNSPVPVCGPVACNDGATLVCFPRIACDQPTAEAMAAAIAAAVNDSSSFCFPEFSATSQGRVVSIVRQGASFWCCVDDPFGGLSGGFPLDTCIEVNNVCDGVSLNGDQPWTEAFRLRKCAESAIGSNYCMTSPNSVGPGMLMSATGDPSIAEACVTLRADSGPANKPGLFFFGPMQLAGAPFGDGLRCVGGMGTVERLPPLAATGPMNGNPAGEAILTLDFSLPYGASITAAPPSINFQYWYRDPSGGPNGFNLSDAIEIAFAP